MQNAMAHVPQVSLRAKAAGDLRRVLDAAELAEAERRLGMANGLQRLSREITGRTRCVGLVPNEARSCGLPPPSSKGQGRLGT